MRSAIAFLRHLAGWGYIMLQMLLPSGASRPHPAQWWRQMDRLVVGSLLLVLVVGFFSGAIMAWQAAYQFRGFSSLSIIGGQTAKVLVMEVGPVLTALVLAGRISTTIAAEVGTMRTTDQLDALRSFGIAPQHYLGKTRVWSTSLGQPFLTLLAVLAGLVGAFVVIKGYLGIPSATFWGSVRTFLTLRDVATGLLKPALFGFISATAGLYWGLTGQQAGAEGVGVGSLRAFVWSAVTVLFADYFLWVLVY